MSLFALSHVLRPCCGLCGESLGSEQAQESRILVAFVGAVAYASCPLCGAETNPKDRVWRQKVRRWVRRQQPPAAGLDNQ